MTQKKSHRGGTNTRKETMASPTKSTQDTGLIESTEPEMENIEEIEQTERTEQVEDTEVSISAKERKAAREAAKKKENFFLILKRTLIATIAGVAAGLICFYFEKDLIGTQGSSDFALLSILIMIACVLMQKHVFMALRIDSGALQAKDWFYQGFMTFGFWLITWTMLLSGTFDEVALEVVVDAAANITTVS